jgi:ParB/RepB/Spo0J family partition protein
VRPQPKLVGEKSLYWIRYGERRWRAHVHAGEHFIRAVVMVMPDTDEAKDKNLLGQLIENMKGLRADVSPLEEAEAMQRLIDRGWNARRIAREMGVKEFRVTQKLDLMRCDESVRALIASGDLSVYHGTELAKLEQADQITLLNRIKRGQLQVCRDPHRGAGILTTEPGRHAGRRR